MKQKTNRLPFIVSIGIIVFTACTSTKVSREQASPQTKTSTAGMCNQTIKYYSEKIIVNGEREINVVTEIIINPSTKLITLESTQPNEEKTHFTTTIESVECNINADLTEGQLIYTGYINQLDGSTTKAIVKVEAKDGSVTIKNGEPDKEGEMAIIISKWEIIRK